MFPPKYWHRGGCDRGLSGTGAAPVTFGIANSQIHLFARICLKNSILCANVCEFFECRNDTINIRCGYPRSAGHAADLVGIKSNPLWTREDSPTGQGTRWTLSGSLSRTDRMRRAKAQEITRLPRSGLGHAGQHERRHAMEKSFERLSIRRGNSHREFTHLWVQRNGSVCLDLTIHIGAEKRRLRTALHTKDIEEAKRLRDEIIAAYSSQQSTSAA